ncbi:hypothetical protein V6N13_058776 [Hibiscus sabdariffa]
MIDGFYMVAIHSPQMTLKNWTLGVEERLWLLVVARKVVKPIVDDGNDGCGGNDNLDVDGEVGDDGREGDGEDDGPLNCWKQVMLGSSIDPT